MIDEPGHYVLDDDLDWDRDDCDDNGDDCDCDDNHDDNGNGHGSHHSSACIEIRANENGDDGYDVDDSTDTQGPGNSAADNDSGPIDIDGGSGNEVEVNGTVYTE